MFEKFLLTVLELIWNQRLGHKKTQLNICNHMLTSSKQLQNRSFHAVERTRTTSKCQKMKNARAKRAKILCQICKFVGFLLPSSSWLLKLPIYFSSPSTSHPEAIRVFCQHYRMRARSDNLKIYLLCRNRRSQALKLLSLYFHR